MADRADSDGQQRFTRGVFARRVGGAVLGWAGTAFVYQLPGFGPALLIGSLSYLTAAEWRRIVSLWLVGERASERPVQQPHTPAAVARS